MILRAKTVLTLTGPPIDNGAVVVEGETIRAVGGWSDLAGEGAGPVRDLGEVVLLPGLINAHCHLEYTDLCGEAPWHGSFTQWLLQVVALKQIKTDADWLSGIARGSEQLRRWGTTTAVNIAAFPRLCDQAETAGLRVIWCPELIDFNRAESAEDIVREAETWLDARPGWLGRCGLAPHAPYTVSGGLYALTARVARARAIWVTTHVAESQEEDDMFRRGLGTMHDYFHRAGRDMSDCKRVGVVQLLREYGVLGPNCLAAHANCLTPADAQLLAQTGTAVVHCPLTHRFFGRGVPLLKSLWHAGVTVCLGTDSLASHTVGSELNLFKEMQELARVFPELAAERILQLATVDAARALGQPSQLGQLQPGARADLIAVAAGNAGDDPYEAAVFTDRPVVFSMIGGQAVIG